MRWSQTYIPTLRESPQEAEIRSHRLMLRAGLIQKTSSGLYTFLPLGLRALKKVEKIIRETMEEHGAIELLMPILQPKEIWLQSGRWEIMKDVMLIAKDRQERSFVLGPTHEEIITELVSRRIKSYRDLPKNFYQMQFKFRDEIRPRFGLMRAREFLMKDGYSFDVDDEKAQKSYWNMVDAYKKIFSRCGLEYRMVEADTGVMGGSLSHEFMVLAESGEDEIYSCTQCGYAANRELAERECVENEGNTKKEIEKVNTPNLKSVEEVSRFLKVKTQKLIKTLIYQADQQTIVVLCRGDVQINEGKLCRLLGIQELKLAGEEAVISITGASSGFSGPIGLKDVKIIADNSIRGIKDAVAGANQNDTHWINVDIERDCSIRDYYDIGYAKVGDLCRKCKKLLELYRGIEVGHVFKLGTKYSIALGANVLNEKGKQVPCIMGCYGIGVSRTLAAFIEQNSNENGILWKRTIAPFEVSVIPVLMEVPEMKTVAEKLYEDLSKEGIDVILDDRDERPGVKFKDGDLIGIPLQLAIGQKFIDTGKVEVLIRKEGKKELIPLENIVQTIKEMLKNL